MFDPAAQITPAAFQYIARSTTICAGAAPRLSTIAPNRVPGGSAKSSPTGSVNRLLARTLYSRMSGGPVSRSTETRSVAANGDVFATSR